MISGAMDIAVSGFMTVLLCGAAVAGRWHWGGRDRTAGRMPPALALLASVSWGLALLLQAPHTVAFAEPRFFAADSFWNMPLAALGNAALPELAGLERLAGAMLRFEPALPAALGWLAVLAAVAGLRRRDRGKYGVLALVLLVPGGALGTYLLPHLAYWAAWQLGFWVFLLLLLLLQHQRHAACACAAHDCPAQPPGSPTGG
jgi:hypothetical protein